MAQQNIDIVGESLESTRDVDERPKLQRISHFLSSLPYETQPRKKVKLPGRDKKNEYDDAATIANRRWIDEKY